MLEVRVLGPTDVEVCAHILDLLTDWFGLPDVNAEYVESLRHLPAFVALDGSDIDGFLAITSHTPRSAEITVMGVRPDRHRRGVGAALVSAARRWCRANNVAWLHVKTRGPSTFDENYEKTRRFYLAQGFDVLYESLTEWGPDDAALILVMRIE